MHTRQGGSGQGLAFHFCPDCGATVWFTLGRDPGTVRIPVGAFADPGFPAPGAELYPHRRQGWAAVTLANGRAGGT